MNRSFVRKNMTAVSIALFIITFGIVQLVAPSFLYNRDGSLRQFGIGKKRKTVLPNWVVAIVLAIFSYLAVSYYLAKRLHF